MSWLSELFGSEATPEQELVLWVEKWKGRGRTEPELAQMLRAMLDQLNLQRKARPAD